MEPTVSDNICICMLEDCTCSRSIIILITSSVSNVLSHYFELIGIT